MEAKHYVSIDIGKAGGIAVINTENSVIGVSPMPKIGDEVDYHELCNQLRPYQNKNCHIVFERLTSLFKVSKAATWSLAHQSGSVQMICIALNLPFTAVPPKQWQAEMFKGIPEITDSTGKRDTKKMALMVVKRLYPELKLTFGERATKPHEGAIDALLMSTYARRQNL